MGELLIAGAILLTGILLVTRGVTVRMKRRARTDGGKDSWGTHRCMAGLRGTYPRKPG